MMRARFSDFCKCPTTAAAVLTLPLLLLVVVARRTGAHRNHHPTKERENRCLSLFLLEKNITLSFSLLFPFSPQEVNYSPLLAASNHCQAQVEVVLVLVLVLVQVGVKVIVGVHTHTHIVVVEKRAHK